MIACERRREERRGEERRGQKGRREEKRGEEWGRDKGKKEKITRWAQDWNYIRHSDFRPATGQP